MVIEYTSYVWQDPRLRDKPGELACAATGGHEFDEGVCMKCGAEEDDGEREDA